MNITDIIAFLQGANWYTSKVSAGKYVTRADRYEITIQRIFTDGSKYFIRLEVQDFMELTFLVKEDATHGPLVDLYNKVHKERNQTQVEKHKQACEKFESFISNQLVKRERN